ncbi:MAG: flavodoxin [Sphaerochaeta sp.]
MKKIAIVYYSGTGNTASLAQAVKEGVIAGGGSAKTIAASLFGADMLDSYDAFAFGCPASGAENLEEEVFEPMFDAIKGHLAGKEVALFGSYGWGDGEWMRTWQESVKESGAILKSESVIALDHPDDEALAAAREMGKTLAS